MDKQLEFSISTWVGIKPIPVIGQPKIKLCHHILLSSAQQNNSHLIQLFGLLQSLLQPHLISSNIQT